MRIIIDIDKVLLNEAISCTKAKTVTELIHEALKEFIRIKKRKDLTELAGHIQFAKTQNRHRRRIIEQGRFHAVKREQWKN